MIRQIDGKASLSGDLQFAIWSSLSRATGNEVDHCIWWREVVCKMTLIGRDHSIDLDRARALSAPHKVMDEVRARQRVDSYARTDKGEAMNLSTLLSSSRDRRHQPMGQSGVTMPSPLGRGRDHRQNSLAWHQSPLGGCNVASPFVLSFKMRCDCPNWSLKARARPIKAAP